MDYFDQEMPLWVKQVGEELEEWRRHLAFPLGATFLIQTVFPEDFPYMNVECKF